MSEVETKTKSPDPRVAMAIAHWAPRFVSNGVLLADFEEVTAGIARWEDWCRAWCERGDVLPFRQVRFRARSETDARRAPAFGRMLPGGASAHAPPRGTRFDTVRGKNPPRNPAATGGWTGRPPILIMA